MLSTRNFFRDLFFICFKFEYLFNFANHIILYIVHVMWKVIVKNPRPVLRILTDGLDQLIEIFTIS